MKFGGETMTDYVTQKIPVFTDDRKINEYYVGMAAKRIIYPGMLQCISITSSNNTGLIGTHVSPGATKKNIDDAFRFLNEFGFDNCQTVYVVGNMEIFKMHTKLDEWKSMSGIASAIRGFTNSNIDILMSDVSTLTREYGGLGLTITAKKENQNVAFSLFAKTSDVTAMDGSVVSKGKKLDSALGSWYFTKA